jgi:hypothetical protein
LAKNDGADPNSDRCGADFEGVCKDLEARARNQGGENFDEGFHHRRKVPVDTGNRIYVVEIGDDLQDYEVMHNQNYKRLQVYERILAATH